MATLINGNGNPAIYAAQDADLIASIMGNTSAIAAVGSEMAATEQDANTIAVADGVCITKEGRRIQLDAGSVDNFTIPTGESGVTNYYIIGYHLVTNADQTQTCETFVQKMSSGSETIIENTFRGGATDVYVSLYRVTQVGFNIDSITALIPKITNINAINTALTNKVDITSTLKNALLDVSNSSLLIQALLANSHELFALNVKDTEEFQYLHSVDGGSTWTTVWSFDINSILTDISNKISKGANTYGGIIDIANSDLTISLNSSASEKFALVAYDTDRLAYVHSTDGGSTWTTIWELTPSHVEAALTVESVGITSTDSTKYVDSGYSYVKKSNGGHLVEVNMLYTLNTSATGDIPIARLGGNYPSNPIIDFAYGWVSGSDPFLIETYIDTSGYVHIDTGHSLSGVTFRFHTTYLR